MHGSLPIGSRAFDSKKTARVECPKPFIVSEDNRDLITYFHS